jgi:cystathionine beta-synthase
VHLLPADSTVLQAGVELARRSAAAKEPAFLALDRGATFGTVHPREVQAMVTRASLQAALERDPLVAGEPASRLGIPFRSVGAGIALADLVATSAGPDPEVLAVLVDGRITATVPATRALANFLPGQVAASSGTDESASTAAGAVSAVNA